MQTYRFKKDKNINKPMEKDGGFKSFLKSNLLSFSVLMIVLFSVVVIAGDVIVNDGQMTLVEDFIVNTDDLFVDVSAGRVGIGTALPNATLDVSGGDTGARIYITNTGGNTPTGIIESTEWASGFLISSNLKYDGSGAPPSNMQYIRGSGGATQGLMLEFDTNEGAFEFYTAPDSTGFDASATLTEQMHINPNGVGIGTASPGTLLEVEDTSIDGNIFRLQDSDGLCNYNPESGSVTVSCSSDESFKTNIVNAPSVIDKILGINVKQYTVTSSGDVRIGPVAQDLQVSNPEMVREVIDEIVDDDGVVISTNTFLTVEQPNPWELVKGMQELINKIQTMERETCSKDSSYSWC